MSCHDVVENAWVFCAKIPLGGWRGYVIDEGGSYACARVIPITVWVVSKNESNCLLENKMISTLIWDMSDYCM